MLLSSSLLNLAINNSSTMCLGMDLFVFILLRVCRSSCLCRLIFSTKFGNFSSNNLCYFLSSLSGTPIMHTLVHLMLSHRSLKLCSLFLILFILCSSDWIISIDLSSTWLTHSSDCWNLLLPLSNDFLFYFSHWAI